MNHAIMKLQTRTCALVKIIKKESTTDAISRQAECQGEEDNEENQTNGSHNPKKKRVNEEDV